MSVNASLGNTLAEPGSHVFIPTISPKSPFASIENISSLLVLSDSTITGGLLPTLYPNPPLVMVTDVITPAVADAVAVALLTTGSA